MAAPHVAGLAAIQGANVMIPNRNYQGAVGVPRVELAEGPGGDKQALGHFERFHPDPIYLSYDSVGAASCNLTGYMNGAYWYHVNNFVPAYTWPVSYLGPGQYRWTLDCVSSAGAHGTTDATARIRRQVTKTAWQISTASTGYAWVEATPGSRFMWSPTGSFSQRNVSENADYCQIKSSGYIGHPNWHRTLLWDSGPHYPANHESGPFYLGNPQTNSPPLGPYDGYLWELRCWNSDGGEGYSWISGTMQP